MKKLFGTLLGVGLIGFGGLMLMGTLARAAESGLGPAGIVAVMMLGLMGVGALILPWAWKAPPPVMATLLGADGKLVSVPCSMLPPGAQTGQVVAVGEMRGLTETPAAHVKAALAPAEKALFER